jgi:hypothetical protein
MQVIQGHLVVRPNRRSAPAIERFNGLRCFAVLANPTSAVEAGFGLLMMHDADLKESFPTMTDLCHQAGKCRRG